MDQQERAGLRKCPEAFQGAQEGEKERKSSWVFVLSPSSQDEAREDVWERGSGGGKTDL